jgi:hypothetical protein
MVILAPAASRAQSRKVMQACERTYQRGVKLERAGKLLEAHKAMETCATDVCGSFLEHQCSAGRDRLLSDMPSVVPVVIDENGAPLTDVEVTMDDEPLRSHLDGRAIRVDPGMHEFSFKRNALVIGTQKIVAIQGKRNQPVVLRLHPAKPAEVPKLKDEQPAAKPPVQVPAAALAEVPPDRTPKRPSYVGSYVLMGSGLVAIAGYGVLTYWGRSDNDQLAQCTPNCLQASVDHIHNLYLAADISLGVGIAAVVTGGYWWWRNHSSVSVSVGPTYASIGGAF